MKAGRSTRVALACAASVACMVHVVACATLGSSGEGDRALPSAGVGPFRAVESREVTGVAPYVFDDRSARYADPSPLADPNSDDGVVLYAVATRRLGDAPTSMIVRTRADDGRAFYGGPFDDRNTPPTVLVPDALWEGGAIRKPAAVIVGERTFLYYAAAGGIGLATSSDGLAFVKEASPVLAAVAAGGPLETGVPDAPSAAVFPDGSVHLFVSVAGSIVEARAADGIHFERVDADPSTPELDAVLGPRGLHHETDAMDGADAGRPFDAAIVTDPWVTLRITEAGRFHVRVLYTGLAGGGELPAIGLAARYGERGRLTRAADPTLTATAGISRPTLVVRGALAFLYANLGRSEVQGGYPGVAAYVTPLGIPLPTPAPAPSSP